MHVNNKKIERNSSPKYQHITYIERTKRKGKEVYFYGVLQSSKKEKWRTMFMQTFWEELSRICGNPKVVNEKNSAPRSLNRNQDESQVIPFW